MGCLAVGVPALLVLGGQWLWRIVHPASGVGIFIVVPLVLTSIFIVVAALGLRSRLKQRSKPEQVVMVLGTSVGIFGTLIATGQELRSGLLSNPMALLVPVGMLLATSGFHLVHRGIKGRRLGDSLHCPKCDYELGVPESEAPIRCSECGYPWLGGWAKGRRVRAPHLAWIGASMLVPPLFVLITTFTSMGGAVVRMLPTGAVIRLASLDAWGHNSMAWAEVGTRPLSPAQEIRLAERLLDVRLRTGYLYGPPSTWLDNAVLVGGAGGPLPQGLRKRYFTELFEPRIDIPDRVDRAAVAQIRFAGPYRAGGAPSWLYVWVDEVRVDGTLLDPAPWRPSASDGWVFALYLAQDLHPFGNTLPGTGLGEPPPLDTSTPGQNHISVQLTECLVARGTTPGKGGPPLFATTATIEKTIVADEAGVPPK